MMSEFLSRHLARYLLKQSPSRNVRSPTDVAALAYVLQPADILLIEGNTRLSVAVKYLTQSPWSHAALYVGVGPGLRSDSGEPRLFVEADVLDGVRAVGLSTFAEYHCRICRPIGLTSEHCQHVISYVVEKIGYQYDLKNVFDLVRYLLPKPPVPVTLRRRMLALGSGDPTRAICSSLIAQEFQSIKYPILPEVTADQSHNTTSPAYVKDILHIRHHSLFVPGDFDISPYFEVVKPTVSRGFDYRALKWQNVQTSA